MKTKISKFEAFRLLDSLRWMLEDNPKALDSYIHPDEKKRLLKRISATQFYLQNSKYDIKNQKLANQAILFKEQNNES